MTCQEIKNKCRMNLEKFLSKFDDNSDYKFVVDTECFDVNIIFYREDATEDQIDQILAQFFRDSYVDHKSKQIIHTEFN